jgi:hypothetical protein
MPPDGSHKMRFVYSSLFLVIDRDLYMEDESCGQSITRVTDRDFEPSLWIIVHANQLVRAQFKSKLPTQKKKNIFEVGK